MIVNTVHIVSLVVTLNEKGIRKGKCRNAEMLKCRKTKIQSKNRKMESRYR